MAQSAALTDGLGQPLHVTARQHQLPRTHKSAAPRAQSVARPPAAAPAAQKYTNTYTSSGSVAVRIRELGHDGVETPVAAELCELGLDLPPQLVEHLARVREALGRAAQVLDRVPLQGLGVRLLLQDVWGQLRTTGVQLVMACSFSLRLPTYLGSGGCSCPRARRARSGTRTCPRSGPRRSPCGLRTGRSGGSCSRRGSGRRPRSGPRAGCSRCRVSFVLRGSQLTLAASSTWPS